MDIHSGRLRFSVAANLAQEFPPVPFVKADKVGKEIDRTDVLSFQIIYCHAEQLPRDSPATVFGFGINSTDVGGKVFSAVKIVFDNDEPADDLFFRPSRDTSRIPFRRSGSCPYS